MFAHHPGEALKLVLKHIERAVFLLTEMSATAVNAAQHRNSQGAKP